MSDRPKGQNGATHRVLVLSGRADSFAADLEPAGDIARFTTCSRYEDLDAALEESRPDVALCFKIGREPFPRETLIGHPGLKWVHAGGAGIDHLLPWRTDSITVTNSSGIHGDIMAQHVLCMMLMFNLRIRDYLVQQTAHRWAAYESRSLQGQTLGVVGFGAVGRSVGAIGRQHGMRVEAIRASGPATLPEADAVFGPEALIEVASRADFLAICLPLTPQTRGLISGDVLDALPRASHLIDVSRGGIVDAEALLDRLKRRVFAGAALDVFEREPLPADSPFWDLDNVIVTPHSSSDIQGWERRVTGMFIDNLRRWHAGDPLRNVVDPALGY
ncbi:MAG: D-2-hydroxyacid dehydrogenase [Salinisphaeraceae bacterium]